jgi:hypothetical protein
MNARAVVIRFARISDPCPTLDGSAIVGRVFVHEPPVLAGLVARDASSWVYLPVSTGAPRLVSTLSRGELERQITEFHFEIADEPSSDDAYPSERMLAASC